MNHNNEHHELAHTLIDDFLNLKGPRTFKDKLPVMNQIIETFNLSSGSVNLQIEPEQLYSLYEHTFIIPELKALLKLVENDKFYDLIIEYSKNKYNNFQSNAKLLLNKFKENNKVKNIDIDNYENMFLSSNCIRYHYQTGNTLNDWIFNYTDVLIVIRKYKLFFKELLCRNKLMFTAFIKYFNAIQPTNTSMDYSTLYDLVYISKFKILATSFFFTYPNEGPYTHKLLLGVCTISNTENIDKELSTSNKTENKKLYKIENIPHGKTFYVDYSEHAELLEYELYPLNTLDCHLIMITNANDLGTNNHEHEFNIHTYEELQEYHKELLQKNNVTFTNIKKAIK